MARFVLMRTEGAEPQLIRETALPLEKDLHDVLTQHPEVIPAEDLMLGSLAVVGRESGLASGYADLVMIDEHGGVCLVEVKTEGNPDTRRVVAQLLDYAATLWGKSLAEFERDVLHAYLAADEEAQQGELPSLSEYLAEQLFATDGAPDLERAEKLGEAVEKTLASGQFSLVVAAPEVPASVQRVLEYMNAQGLRLFAVEVSYFKGSQSGKPECFVPRVVTMPRLSDPSGRAPSQPLDLATFLESVPEDKSDLIRDGLERLTAAGAAIQWKAYGPSVTVTRDVTRQVCAFEAGKAWITLQASGGFPPEPFEEAAKSLATLGVGTQSKDGWYRHIRWNACTAEQASTAVDVAVKLATRLAPAVAWEPLDTPVAVTFTRNDHNIWVKHVPDLNGLVGRWLRGRLERAPGGPESPVVLVPLAGGQPGWRPTSQQGLGDLWPTGQSGEDYRLTIEAAG